MKFTLHAALVSVLTVVPATVWAADPALRELMIKTFEAHDCQVEAKTLRSAFKDAGFDSKDMQRTARALATEGSIGMIDKDNAYLKTGEKCEGFKAPEIIADPAVTAALVTAFEQADCNLPVSRLNQQLDDQFGRSETDTALAALINNGALSLGDETATLITGSVCGSQ